MILNPRTGTAETPPNVVGNVYFSTASFVAQSPGMLGNSGRNFFHGPGINNFDFALFKDTRLTESKMLELRFEFFNLFNHTQFSGINSTINFNRLPLPIAGDPGFTVTNLPVFTSDGRVTEATKNGFGTVSGARDPRNVQLVVRFVF